MIFTDFKDLINKINRDLGAYCNEFQYKRKELTGASKTAGNNELFGNVNEDEGWAINRGGGTEVQYHIGFDAPTLEIRYGIGFNTQYVPFANDMSMVEYLAPYIQAFLKLQAEIQTDLPDYSFVYGSADEMQNPENNKYYLFGATFTVSKNTGGYELKGVDYSRLLADLKKQFTPYVKIFELRNKLKSMKQDNQKTIELLTYKKQVILQGPPGTGKTREAKKIAKLLTRQEEITKEDILSFITAGQVINTSTASSSFTVNDFINEQVRITLNATGKSYNIPYKDIIQAYLKKIWLKGEIRSGNDPYSAAIAKHIHENGLSSENVKIIQFHPAYSYEDFVRGISVKNNNSQIEYKTENKVIADFAGKALKNYSDSLKEVALLSNEAWIDDQFEEFKESVIDEIEDKDNYKINNKAYISELEEDAFRYKGDNWSASYRMPFNEIIRLYHLGIKARREIIANPQIKARTKQHATYYFNVLAKFRAYIGNKEMPEATTKVKLRNYVLIIDEINRANLSSVLGELIYALEYRYDENNPAETTVECMYELDGDKKLALPKNLYIIGTMNTADRSVSHIDYAIRRRFAFIDMPPAIAVIDEVIKNNTELNKKAKDLFNKVAELFHEKTNSDDHSPVYLQADFKAKDVQPGHSYFLAESSDQLKIKLDHEIRPLLHEYVKDGILSENAVERINNLW